MGRTGLQTPSSSLHGRAGSSLRFTHLKRPLGPGATPMNVTLNPFDCAQAVARAGLNTDGMPLAKGKAVEGGGFQQALTNALRSVSETHNQAAQMQREVQLDNPNVSIEETMVAMQKAQIGFQATLQVRNRLVQAYSDIMNMQV